MFPIKNKEELEIFEDRIFRNTAVILHIIFFNTHLLFNEN